MNWKGKSFLFGLLMSSAVSFGQSDDALKVGLELGTMQYRSDDMTSEYWKFSDAHIAAGISLGGSINEFFDWRLGFQHGVIDHDQFNVTDWGDTVLYSFDNSLVNFNFLLSFKLANGKILPEDFPIKPFLSAGIGNTWAFADHYSDGTDVKFNYPLGFGFELPINDKFMLSYQTVDNYTLGDNLDNLVKDYQENNKNDKFIFHSIGLKLIIDGGEAGE